MNKEMTRLEVIEHIKGRIVKDIEYGEYLGWFTVDSITFDDGTILELGGNADYARIDGIEIPSHGFIAIEQIDD